MKTPRDYQTEAATALFFAINKPDCNPIVAIPTGSGKTMVMTEFIELCLEQDFSRPILVLSHVKEILQQNYDAIEEHFGELLVGIYSAGLGERNVKKITVAGIQSVHRKSDTFKEFGIVIIDECHLVNTRQSGMYRKFLSEINASYVGLTATHFRTGHGYIHEGEEALFNSLVYDKCDIAGFNDLIDRGYLSNLIAKGTKMKLDPTGVKITAGDYANKDLSKKLDRDDITKKAVAEIVKFGSPYKKWLVFAIDIKHAENITKALRGKGITVGCVHSKMITDRETVISSFKRGDIKCIVNVDILTTGFDAPDIDLIAMLRPTQSPILHVQALGRGMRIAPGKDHCLVLDFAGNVARLGPINDVTIRTIAKREGNGKPRMKECPSCQGYLHTAAKECEYCGYEFPVTEKIELTAFEGDIVAKNSSSAEKIKPELQKQWHDIKAMHYYPHSKPLKPSMVKAVYFIGNKSITEYICLEHTGYASHKARNWVRFRYQGPSDSLPRTSSELLRSAKNDHLKDPKRILISFGKFPSIHDVEF
tara:strand:- start:4943 stop:6547 length:1605 start_codon:yes stop_codon:yes gene_type:complete